MGSPLPRLWPALPSALRGREGKVGVGALGKAFARARLRRRLPVRHTPASILLFADGMQTRRKLTLHPTDRTGADLDEIHHLLEGFEQELVKLEEALETLSAYLLRLQSQPLTRRRTLN